MAIKNVTMNELPIYLLPSNDKSNLHRIQYDIFL